ncbi:MAG: succinylglutamate desuccinylase/aspartoacylase family protein [Atopobiaceae bacterium]|nr:succinylglutamate desuccinylase/aspartoacylase family protein [Atopobiaceae bacterium]
MRRDVSVRELPTGERMRIVKHRYMPIGLSEAEVSCLPRACIVTGVHGDELEGQYVIYELVRRLLAQPQNLAGVVDIYPSVNPMGMGAIERGIPQFDLDMDRIFPGSHGASPFEAMAADLVEDVRGAQVAFDLHSSDVYLRELPQIRINEESADRLLPFARLANVDYVWIHESAVVLKGTFAYSMNSLGVPTLVVEAGAGMRITPDVGEQLAIGILSVLAQVGVWTGPLPLVRSPQVSTDGAVSYLHAESAGMFVPCVTFGKEVKEGQVIGRILDCGSATVLQELRSPVRGLLFTLREYPLVYPGNLIARVLGGAPC